MFFAARRLFESTRTLIWRLLRAPVASSLQDRLNWETAGWRTFPQCRNVTGDVELMRQENVSESSSANASLVASIGGSHQ